MDKNDLRKEIRQQKRHFSSEELTEMSLRVMERLLCHDRIKNAKTVMMYYSLPDEVFTHDVVDVLLERGVKVVLPVVTGDTTMELREYNGKDDIAIGAFRKDPPPSHWHTPFPEYSGIDGSQVLHMQELNAVRVFLRPLLHAVFLLTPPSMPRLTAPIALPHQRINR